MNFCTGRALVASSILTLLAAAAAAGEFTERYDLNAHELRVVNLIGRIVLEPADGDRFAVEVRVRGDDASREHIEIEVDEGREALVRVVFPVGRERRYVYPPLGRGKSTITFDNDGDAASSWFGKVVRGFKGDKITVAGRGKGLEVWADVTVRVPRDRAADVRLGVGEIEAEGVAGDLVLDINSGPVSARRIRGSVLGDTGSGSVDFSDIEGNVDADTGSGGVTIARCRGDRIHADTGSGSVHVEDVECGKLHIDTGSGGVTAARVKTDAAHIDTGSGRVKLQLLRMGRGKFIVDTGSGGIDLVLPRGASAEVTADTGSGGITVDLPGVETGRKKRDELRFTIGDGDARVILDTGSGGIRISMK
ncbi:DUF4097 domain-containing protein [bacterium]|nr:DUF4097 domain-containing protein [bacterium]MBU1675245.1 DUF4097 domain-containing protein [bacterium]